MTDDFLPVFARDVALKHQLAGTGYNLIDVAVVVAVQGAKMLFIEWMHVANQEAKPGARTADKPLRSWYAQIWRTHSARGIAKSIENRCPVLKLEQSARRRRYIVAYPEVEIGERCALKNPDVKRTAQPDPAV